MKQPQTFYSRRKNGTKTSSFGTPGRINHDASSFYKSRLYEGLNQEKNVKYIENPIDPGNINKIFCKSSEVMAELPDNSVHLMVTSPPYNVGKDYDVNLSLEEYLNLLKRIFQETYRVLVPGGRACINVANLGRKPYIPLHSYIIEYACYRLLMRGEIIWNKGSSASPSTAWGTWLLANNPVLRDVNEYILVFAKKLFTQESNKRKVRLPRKSFWNLRKASGLSGRTCRESRAPAPFPVELPYRAIQLYTFEEKLSDPFAGAGTTCITA